ncbi:MAG TPA: hypothetical protein EYG57_14715 [Planctomycetes bacterium]|nr:hypothetical protein [Planctomycetota bacterium]
MSDYEHTQPGTLLRIVLGLFVLALGVTAIIFLSGVSREAGIIFLLVAALLAFVLLVFHSLTVQVNRNEISLRFGIGIVKKSFSSAEIKTVEQVRNRWFYGWGIKLTPEGWLYSVSGLDAVQIVMQDGRKTRIGTDEPEKLLAAIESVIRE